MNLKRWWCDSSTLMGTKETPLKALMAECVQLEQSLKFTKDRFFCLMNVMKSHPTPTQYEFHTTTKGIPVVLCIADEGRELKLYNLNNNHEANCMLRLSATYFGKEANITNIVGGVRLGHGRLAIERFLELCKNKEIEKASTQFLVIEKDTEKALTGFFAKFGFEVYDQVGYLWTLRINLHENI